MTHTIVAKKAGLKLPHVEAGFRSGDLSMLEEIKRMVTDSITDYFFTTTLQVSTTFEKLGITKRQIYFVGSAMTDTLPINENRLQQPKLWKSLQLETRKKMVMTLHIPCDSDATEQLKASIGPPGALGTAYPILCFVHPKTKTCLEGVNLNFENLQYVTSLRNLEFNYPAKNAFAVPTDTLKITEETTVWKWVKKVLFLNFWMGMLLDESLPTS